jgi:hypothetical protein
MKKNLIESIELPSRISNSLKRGGIKTIDDLLSRDAKSLMKVKNIGVKSVFCINRVLNEKFDKIIKGSNKFVNQAKKQYAQKRQDEKQKLENLKALQRKMGGVKKKIKQSFENAIKNSYFALDFIDYQTKSWIQFTIYDTYLVLFVSSASALNMTIDILYELKKLLTSLSFIKVKDGYWRLQSIKIQSKYIHKLESIMDFKCSYDCIYVECGEDLNLITQLVDNIFRKVFKLPSNYILEVRYLR